jgi:hypothetical protein
MVLCTTDPIGASSFADWDALIIRLRHLAEGDDGYYESRRRLEVSQRN